MAPRFLCGKSKNWREQPTKRVENFMHDCLRRSTARGIRRVAIHPVFGNVDVEAAQIDGAKLIECVIDLVELERLVTRSTSADHFIQALENPAVNQRCSGGR